MWGAMVVFASILFDYYERGRGQDRKAARDGYGRCLFGVPGSKGLVALQFCEKCP